MLESQTSQVIHNPAILIVNNPIKLGVKKIPPTGAKGTETDKKNEKKEETKT